MRFKPHNALAASMIAATSNFWIPVAVLYHQQRGATLEQVLSLIGFHYLCVVILEYPTGVIGDRIGYKKSVLMGHAIMALSFLLLAIPGSLPYYFFCVFLTALARTFTSGSDIAWFHTVAEHFQRNISTMKFHATVWSVISMILGGLLGAHAAVYTYLATAVASLIAFACAAIVPERASARNTTEDPNIFRFAAQGLLHALRHPQLRVLSLLGMFFMGFFVSIKWFYNPIFELFSIDVAWWGALIAFFTLVRAFGVKGLQRVPLLYQLIGVILLVALVGTLRHAAIVIGGFILINVLHGSIETLLTIKVNEYAKDEIRAATHSLQSLLQKLFSSSYLFVAGAALSLVGLHWIFYGTAFVIGIICAVVVVLHRRTIWHSII